MAGQNYLQRLRQYKSFLETEYKRMDNAPHNLFIEEDICSIAEMNSFRRAKIKLESLFPELNQKSRVRRRK